VDELPNQIGPYEVRDRLGHGGMGVVYLGFDPMLDRPVAIKVLKVPDDETRRRFLREARLAARVHHPHIVSIYAVGEHEGNPYLAMEFIAGRTMAQVIRGGEQVPLARKVHWLSELCAGLGHAHQSGIVHRDVKPSNLLIAQSTGALRLLDFGIAHGNEASAMTMAGMIVGTPQYMSPEQITGQAVDARSDLFSVGTVAYELLTGRQAFGGDNLYHVSRQIVGEQPRPLESFVPDAPAALIKAIARCLQKDPGARPQDAKIMEREFLSIARRLDPEHTLVVVATEATMVTAPSKDATTSRVEMLREASDAIEQGQFTTASGLLQKLESGAPNADVQQLRHRLQARRLEARIQEALGRAEEALQTGSLDEGETAIHALAELSPRHPELERLRAALQSRVDDRQVATLTSRARQALQQDRLDDAHALIAEALALAPDAADAIAVQQRLLDRTRAQRIARLVAQANRSLDQDDEPGARRAIEALTRLDASHRDVDRLQARLQALLLETTGLTQITPATPAPTAPVAPAPVAATTPPPAAPEPPVEAPRATSVPEAGGPASTAPAEAVAAAAAAAADKPVAPVAGDATKPPATKSAPLKSVIVTGRDKAEAPSTQAPARQPEAPAAAARPSGSPQPSPATARPAAAAAVDGLLLREPASAEAAADMAQGMRLSREATSSDAEGAPITPGPTPVPRPSPMPKVAAAAVVLLLLAGGGYYALVIAPRPASESTSTPSSGPGSTGPTTPPPATIPAPSANAPAAGATPAPEAAVPTTPAIAPRTDPWVTVRQHVAGGRFDRAIAAIDQVQGVSAAEAQTERQRVVDNAARFALAARRGAEDLRLTRSSQYVLGTTSQAEAERERAAGRLRAAVTSYGEARAHYLQAFTDSGKAPTAAIAAPPVAEPPATPAPGAPGSAPANAPANAAANPPTTAATPANGTATPPAPSAEARTDLSIWSNDEARAAISQFTGAYLGRDMGGLNRLWPTMDPAWRAEFREAFATSGELVCVFENVTIVRASDEFNVSARLLTQLPGGDLRRRTLIITLVPARDRLVIGNIRVR
jgi:tetratricopeptide (TPR) repeat protein/predicted Ser/Thr protein kinase